MKHLFTFFILMPGLFLGKLCAQNTPLYKIRSADTFVEKWVIKFAPYSLADIDGTVQGAVEYVINPSFSIQQELGYGRFAFWAVDNQPRIPRTVFRARTELRWYLSRYEQNPEGFYLALEAFYKYVSMARDEEVNMGSYFQKLEYQRIKNVVGGHFKVGWQVRLSDRWLIDLYTGVGVRAIYIDTPGRPASIWSTRRLFGERPPGTYVLPSLAMGLKVGYILYGKRKAGNP